MNLHFLEQAGVEYTKARKGFQTGVKFRRWLIRDVILAEPLSNTDHNIITFTLPGVRS